MTNKHEIVDCEQPETIVEAESIYTVRKVWGLADIEEICPEFEEMPWKDKETMLYGAGLDTVKYHLERLDGEYVSSKGKRTTGIHYACNERTDDDWVTLEIHGHKLASIEAIIENAREKHGNAHARDLQMMARGGRI